MNRLHINKIIVSFLVLAILSGCSADFLEKKPLGQLTSDNFFDTEDHAVWATNAVYEQMRSWDVHVFSYIGLTDIISDDSDKGSTASDATFLNELDLFAFDAENIAFGSVWGGYYRGIYRANIALENIPAIDMDDGLKERLLGECRFLRGYFYFNLVRWFGDIPLIDHILTEDEYEQGNDSAADIYAFIINDLEAAMAVLPAKYSAADEGRVTKGAAEALLAKVYLTLEDFPKAETHALNVIESEEYALMDSYPSIFLPEGDNSSESIFEVQAAAFDTGGGGTQYNEVQGVRGTPNLGWGFNRPSDDFVLAFEIGDPRREATILYPGEVLPDGSQVVEDNPNIVNERYNQKAWVPTHAGGNGNGSGNIKILRYADVLLMAAEALNENDKPADALIYLNMVRDRARGGNSFVLPEVTDTDKDVLRDKIWHERRVELGMEQQRWFDLIRQKRAASVMQALGKNFVEGKHELLPIPQTEIDLSGGLMKQNAGY